ncbi:MAG TPA: hypothetical protein VKZ85_05185 [Woeseiaceae bacterium]|nr:hypothetical protein [Woeseiaceae bacterium]
MFKLLGVLLSGYIVYAVAAGRVVAKSGPWARVVLRHERPRYFWAIIVTYSALAVALLTYF